MVITNKGTFGQDETGNNGGLWWRFSGYTTAWCYIFGAGPWFGTITETGDTLVTIGYGPSGGQFEFGCGLGNMSVSHPDAIIYRYPTPWPPPSATYPMAPQTYKSHQDSWCAYNDLDIQYHMPGDTRPIGLEVYQTVYAWNLTTTADIIFLKFDCKNVSGQTLNDCYFGVITDNDIGNEAGPAANDRCSAILNREYLFPGDTVPIVVDNLGYQWQEVPEGSWPIFPGTIGFDYLQSPYRLEAGQDRDNDGIDDGVERDSAYYWNNVPSAQWDVDLDGTPDWRDPSENPQWGMTSFRRFTLDLEPSRDNQRYVTMAGYNFVTGQYDPFDTIIPDPADQRFGQCSGPFELLPESTVTVLVAVMVTAWSDLAPGAPPGYPTFGTPDSALALVDRTAQFIFDQNWLLPGPPAPPNLTLLPGDAKITLLWDTFAETFPDPYYDVVGLDSNQVPPVPFNAVLYDSFYLKYDFQGYGVWKSIDGLEYELLARYDKADDVAFDDTETGIYATNTGLVHSFVDEDVRNGFTYYYAVTAFDYNYVAAESAGVAYGRPLWFESGRVGVTTMARRDPANLVPAGTPLIEVEFGNPSLDTFASANPIFPLEISIDRPLYLEFLASEPVSVPVGDDYILGARYTANIKNVDDSIVEVASVELQLGTGFAFNEFPPVEGLMVTSMLGTQVMPTQIQMFEAVETGAYPDTLIRVDYLAPLPTTAVHYDYGFWAYRGNDYRVEWRKTDPAGPVNTVLVTDLVLGDTIPFQPFNNTDTTRHLAECWCFGGAQLNLPWGFGSSDTIVTAGPGPGRSRYLYINGGLFGLNLGAAMADTLRPEENEVWIVRANRAYLPASVYATIKISATGGYYATAMDEPLNVKVVPNPYIIANEWQLNIQNRMLKFINLPADCVIRIFTLNGELVRMIEHRATSEGSAVEGDLGGDEWWDLLSDNRQLIASGVYIFHVQADVGEQVGKFVLIR
jgi:hypothetical protein